MLAAFVTGPLGGVLADRFDRRRLMIATDIGRAIVVVGFLAVRDAGDLWMLYALTAVQLGLTGIFCGGSRIDPRQRRHRRTGGACRWCTCGLTVFAICRASSTSSSLCFTSFAIALTASGAFQVIQVALAKQVYSGAWRLNESMVLGLLYAVVGIGTGVGPIVGRAFTGDRHPDLRRAIAVAYALSAAGILIVARLPAFEVALAGVALRGIG